MMKQTQQRMCSVRNALLSKATPWNNLTASNCLAVPRRAAALVAACLLVAACALPALAWAEDDTSSNQVYVNQLSDSSFLYETSIADIAQADSYYDGQTVQIQGEVVGDLVNDELSSDTCWVTLQDDEVSPSTVSVYLTREQASVIDTFGQYGQVGTTLQVRGTVHLECSEHQGMADIHASEVSALEAGYAEEAAVDPNILRAGFGAVVVGVALFAVYHVRRERSL